MLALLADLPDADCALGAVALGRIPNRRGQTKSMGGARRAPTLICPTTAKETDGDEKLSLCNRVLKSQFFLAQSNAGKHMGSMGRVSTDF
jgi:hypothetical protein